MEPITIPAGTDVQASAPTIHVSLSRVGVTNVEKVIRIGPPGAEQLYYAKLDCFVDLGPKQKGAHMSRFEEVVNDVVGEQDFSLRAHAPTSLEYALRSERPPQAAPLSLPHMA